jgi:anti-sigma regulatory factor (Ser/Thr protein kinase)
MPRRELTLTNDTAELPGLIAAIEELAESEGLGGPAVMQLVLAVDELVTNAMTHAYRAGAHELRVAIDLAPGGRMTIEIIDDGPAFDPLAAPPPDLEAELEDRAVGGLGIHLARQMVDELSYRREGDRNRLQLAKELAPAD